jgi:hypothetical protein
VTRLYSSLLLRLTFGAITYATDDAGCQDMGPTGSDTRDALRAATDDDASSSSRGEQN